ncbi:uncharacterized protein LOC142344381 [Convolutriloba macropyga]|uniref:uncharacterized protein LOC142344381 n=1 Tax=Convolutriloba macropyga TaxID=536237 RepID=UPI003F528549
MSGGAVEAAKKHQCSVWAKKVEAACEEDKWGQVLDAAEQYEQVMKAIVTSVDNGLNNNNDESSEGVQWDQGETDFLQNVALCLKQRLDVIQSPISKDKQFPRESVAEVIPHLRSFSLQLPKSLKSSGQGASNHNQRKMSQQLLSKMKNGVVVEMDASAEHLEKITSSRKGSLIDYAASSRLAQSSRSRSIEDDSDGDVEDGSANGASVAGTSKDGNYEITTNTVVAVVKPGNLLPKPRKKRGETLLSITILRVALKDATKTLDSYWTVSVKDSKGLDVDVIQETPSCGLIKDNFITFDSTVHIQKHLEALPANWAIFLELKHFKKEKQLHSVKCWAMLESDEISTTEKKQEVICELYKKPTDFKRKKLSLLTSKELYLYLFIKIT